DRRAVASEDRHRADDRQLLVVDLERLVGRLLAGRAGAAQQQFAAPDYRVERYLGDLRLAGGLDHDVEAARRGLFDVVERLPERLETERAGDLQPVRVDVDDRDLAGAIEAGDLRVLQAHRSRAVDQVAVARARVDQVEAVDHAADRLDQR